MSLFHEKLKSKILSAAGAKKQSAKWRSAGKKVVFTNGCFDILHPGHVDYLQRARDLGDCLVVGVNTDDSVRRLGKSPGRPINSEQARAMVVAGLQSVDAVVLFNEDTPYELIRLLEPDILVKGSDYTVEQIAGHDLVIARGGLVKTIPLLEGYSTTAVVNRAKNG